MASPSSAAPAPHLDEEEEEDPLFELRCLESLNVSGCRVGHAGAAALASMVHHGQLVGLKLARNVPTEGGIAALASALSSPFVALEHLDLSGCRVTDSGALALVTANAMAPDGRLKSLRLHDNVLSEGGGKALHRAMAQFSSDEAEPPSVGGIIPAWSTEGGYAGIDGGGSFGGSLGGGTPRKRGGKGIESITLHGNQVSHFTHSGIRDVCTTNKQSGSLDSQMQARITELEPKEVELHAIQHELTKERQLASVAAMQLEAVEKKLAELRREEAEANRAFSEKHADAMSRVDEAMGHLHAIDAELKEEEAKFEAERDAMEADLKKLLARRWQLERLDAARSPTSPTSPTRRMRKPVELLPGQVEPPPLEEAYEKMMEEEAIHNAHMHKIKIRETRSRMRIRWAEDQIEEIREILDRASKAKAAAAPAKPGGKGKAKK